MYPLSDESKDSDELVDVPKDGKTVGEIVTTGNIVMKEVSVIKFQFYHHTHR